MKTIIFFVVVLTVSVAKDDAANSVAERKPSPFTFNYHSDEMLSMHIYLKNLVPNVAADMYLKYLSGGIMGTMEIDVIKSEKQFNIRRLLKYNKIFIDLELSTTAGVCTTYNIVNATNVPRDMTPRRQDMSYNDICLKEEPCVIEVDLLNNICELLSKPTNEPFKPSDETATNKSTRSDNEGKEQEKLQAVLIYVILVLSVSGMCVIILGIYISVKKYCHRNLHPTEATELNTYATAHEVVYADLSLVQGNSRPPRCDEESTYAKIIGVMRPVPR